MSPCSTSLLRIQLYSPAIGTADEPSGAMEAGMSTNSNSQSRLAAIADTHSRVVNWRESAALKIRPSTASGLSSARRTNSAALGDAPREAMPSPPACTIHRDRKGVVEGKRVAVRVDSGGRRNYKQKNKNT